LRVHIIGILGNMGRRYEAILRTYGYKVTGEDIGLVDAGGSGNAQGYIVATPTDTHIDVLKRIAHRGKPILCEKPLSKDLDALEKILHFCDAEKTKLSMVSQYDYLIDEVGEGLTSYDYFKHGSDGLYWDCINIVKHARGKVELRETSPVWQCQINGQRIQPGLMDMAYIEMILDWVKNPSPTDLGAIWDAHKKVADLEAEAKCKLS
jgi:hypothetical protein